MSTGHGIKNESGNKNLFLIPQKDQIEQKEQSEQNEQKDQKNAEEPPKVTEEIVTETEKMPIAAAKFRPRTPILEDAQEDRVLSPDRLATPRPSVTSEKSLSPSPTPSNQPPSDVKPSCSPTPTVDAKVENKTDSVPTISLQKIDVPEASEPAPSPKKPVKPETTEAAPQAAIKTYTTEKGKSKITGKTIGGWI